MPVFDPLWIYLSPAVHTERCAASVIPRTHAEYYPSANHQDLPSAMLQSVVSFHSSNHHPTSRLMRQPARMPPSLPRLAPHAEQGRNPSVHIWWEILPLRRDQWYVVESVS